MILIWIDNYDNNWDIALVIVIFSFLGKGQEKIHVI